MGHPFANDGAISMRLWHPDSDEVVELDPLDLPECLGTFALGVTGEAVTAFTPDTVTTVDGVSLTWGLRGGTVAPSAGPTTSG